MSLEVKKESSFPSFPSVKVEGVEPSFVSKVFKKGSKELFRIIRMGELFEKLFKGEEGGINFLTAQKVLASLQVWGMHYLSKGARIPLLNQHGPFHLSFIDYLKSDNEASYYRGDGGSIIKTFKNHFKGKYLQGTKCKCDVIKPAKFQDLILCACNDKQMSFYGGKYECHQAQMLSQLEGQQHSECSFIDVSSMLQQAFMDKKSEHAWESMLKEVQARVDLLPERTVVGGLVIIDQGVGVYVTFNPTKDRSEAIQYDIDSGILAIFKNFRGAIGAYPDVMLLKNALMKEGVALTSLFPSDFSFPCASEISAPIYEGSDLSGAIEKEFNSLLMKIRKCGENPRSKDHPLVKHYFPLIFNLLARLQSEVLIQVNDKQFDAVIGGFVLKALQAASKQVEKIQFLFAENNELSGVEKFAEATQRIYLIIEQVLALITLYTPKSGLKKLTDELQMQFPMESSLQSAGLGREFLSFSSGMSSLDYILESHLCSMQKKAEKPKVVFIEGSYYELTLDTGFKGRYSSLCEAEIQSVDKAMSSSENCDVMFLDLHPNFVTLKEVKTNPVVELVFQALKNRTGNEPLTVALDISTTLSSDADVREIVEQLKGPIAEGRLNLAIVTSLAKFYNMGLDKYPGGLVEFYSSPKNKFAESMLTHMHQKETEDPISHESQRFFSLLFSSCVQEVSFYHERIRENNNLLYKAVAKDLQQPDACVQLAVKGPKIPMLGLQFDNFVGKILKKDAKENEDNLIASDASDEIVDPEKLETAIVRFTKLMEFYIYNKAYAQKLPLQIRGSFPFPNASVVECKMAVRIVVGLEDESILLGYAEMLKAVDADLKAFLSGNEDEKGALAALLMGEEEDFDNAVESLIPKEGTKDLMTFASFLKRMSSEVL